MVDDDNGSVEDDFWLEDEGDGGGRPGGGISPLAIGLAALAVVVLIVIVIASRGSKDDGNKDGPGETAAQADGGDAAATTTTKTCLEWPEAVSSFSEPPIASQPGLHVWTDVDGWHVRRVPGGGVEGVKVTITTNNAEHPPEAGTGDGGATSVLEGASVVLALPAGASSSNASFKVPFYANQITLDVRDDAGTALPAASIVSGKGETPTAANPMVITRERRPC